MAVRLLETETDSEANRLHLPVTVDPTASHYLKLTMDSVFGPSNFHSEITWKRTNAKGLAFKGYPNNADLLLYYSKADHFTWNRNQFRPHDTVLRGQVLSEH